MYIINFYFYYKLTNKWHRVVWKTRVRCEKPGCNRPKSVKIWSSSYANIEQGASFFFSFINIAKEICFSSRCTYCSKIIINQNASIKIARVPLQWFIWFAPTMLSLLMHPIKISKTIQPKKWHTVESRTLLNSGLFHAQVNKRNF